MRMAFFGMSAGDFLARHFAVFLIRKRMLVIMTVVAKMLWRPAGFTGRRHPRIVFDQVANVRRCRISSIETQEDREKKSEERAHLAGMLSWRERLVDYRFFGVLADQQGLLRKSPPALAPPLAG